MASKWVPVVSQSHLDPVTNTAQAVSPPSLDKLEQDVPGTGPEVAVPWQGVRVGISAHPSGVLDSSPAKVWELGQSRAVGEQWCEWKCTLSHVWVSVVFNFFRV